MGLPPGVKRLGSGELCVQVAECRLRCNFCSHGLAKRAGRAPRISGPPPHGPLRGRRRRLYRDWIRLRLGEELEQLPVGPEPVALGGWDPLEYDDTPALVHLLRRAGRAVRIVSPGLRLADRGFAAELSRMAPAFVLTYLSTSRTRYASMTGLPDAQDQVHRALGNLRSLGAPLAVNMVLTAENLDELTRVADFVFGDLGLSQMSVLAVLPDRSHLALDPGFLARIPDYRLLGEEVARCVARHGPRKRILCLWNVPPCKVPVRALASGHLCFAPWQGEIDHPTEDAAECQSCGYRRRCGVVSPAYRERFPEDVFDPTVVHPFVTRLLTGHAWK